MKQIQIRLSLLFACIFSILTLSAHDFEVDGIYYNITNKSAKEVCVTYHGERSDKYTDRYSGQISIPEKVSYKYTTYTVTSIGENAFKGCSGLISVDIPNSVRSIEDWAFEFCKSLISVNIPNSVTSIGVAAFFGCSILSSVTIPNSVNTIGEAVFADCKSIQSFYGKFVSTDNRCLIDNGRLISFAPSGLTSYCIPNSVTEVKLSAFLNCINLTSVSIPNSVTSIGQHAFEGCSGLTSVIIPNSVSTIREYAFYDCTNLTSVTIPNSVTQIGKVAFDRCKKLISVKIPEGTPESAASRKCFDDRLITYVPASEIGTSAEPAPKFDPKAFPIINIEKVEFADNGNNLIESGETCNIKVTISNTGKGAARGCVAKVTASSAPGITVKNVNLPEIGAGKTITQNIEVKAGMNTVDGKAQFGVSVDEPNGMGADPVLLAVATKAFEAPKVLVSDYSITSAKGAQLVKKEPFDLQVLVQNLAHGKADDVKVSISLPANVYLIDGDELTNLGHLDGGQTREMNYSLLVNNNYTATTIPVKLTLQEKHGKYAESKTINLTINQPLANNKIDIKAINTPKNDNIQIAQIQGKVQQAEVDINIPATANQRPKTFAVLFGNEEYSNEIRVPFAVNDANIMAQYLHTTLGIPEKNIRVATNATRNNMVMQIDWLKKVAEAYRDCNIIVYYSGHGMPDEASGQPHLIPVDGYSTNKNTCYDLTSLYQELAAMCAKNVTVIIDACFSGADRDDGMLLAAKGVKIKSQSSIPNAGAMVVMSASQGDETAFPYHEKSHGMFTYYLLKKLQDTKGNVSLGELSDYVTEQVKCQSIVENNKSQTPSIAVTPAISSSWRSIRW